MMGEEKCEFTCEGDWLKLNAGQTSFVRVNYDEEGWKSLQEPISSRTLPPVDRLGIVMDAFALAKAGMMATPTALDLCRAYKKEDCYPVWNAVSSGLAEVSDICSGCDFFKKYESFCGEIFGDLHAKLGWAPADGESDLTKKLRALCLGAAAKYGNEAVVKEALSRFKSYCDGGELDADLRSVVFKCAVKFGGSAEFDKMLELYESLPTPEQQMTALTAASLTRDPDCIAKYLEFAFSGKVKKNNVLYVFAGLAGNASARDIAWEFVKANWKSKITPMFEGSHGLYAYMVALPIRGFVTFEKAKEAEDFFTENPVPAASMRLSQTLESIRTRASWLQREEKALEAFFA